ncbi:MAG: protease inhibitor Inh/omp19 family protein [Cohaesibacter sp.]|nr:protease inhibitor Inh/omp19 family protein [Cohaesibacter sp.]
MPSSYSLCLSILCLATGLSACQTTAPTYQQSTARGSAPMHPSLLDQLNRNQTSTRHASTQAQQKKIWSDSSSKTRRYVQPNGTLVTKTTSSSANVSFNKDAAANAVGGLILAALAGASLTQSTPTTPQQIAGKWRLYETKGSKSCSLDLRPNQWFGAYQGWAGTGCPAGLFGSMKWNVVGNQIVITTMTNQVVMRLNKHQINRWSGTSIQKNIQLTLAR